MIFKHVFYFFISSSSVNIPLQSRGCKKITGLPCAPILGFLSIGSIPIVLKCSSANEMSSTS